MLWEVGGVQRPLCQKPCVRPGYQRVRKATQWQKKERKKVIIKKEKIWGKRPPVWPEKPLPHLKQSSTVWGVEGNLRGIHIKNILICAPPSGVLFCSVVRVMLHLQQQPRLHQEGKQQLPWGLGAMCSLYKPRACTKRSNQMLIFLPNKSTPSLTW